MLQNRNLKKACYWLSVKAPSMASLIPRWEDCPHGHCMMAEVLFVHQAMDTTTGVAHCSLLKFTKNSVLTPASGSHSRHVGTVFSVMGGWSRGSLQCLLTFPALWPKGQLLSISERFSVKKMRAIGVSELLASSAPV